MPHSKLVSKCVNELELELAKYKAVLKEFPNAKANRYGEFQCNSVNQRYTDYEFNANHWAVTVSPYYKINFLFENKEHLIKVRSKPVQSKLVYVKYVSEIRNYEIRFARLTFNMKHNSFREDMLNACQVEIMKFVQEHPKYLLNKKHLDPRLKKLLAFT